jgi:error-prone DNA polymerase
MNAVMYAELHCLSNFSFLRAASHPEELVQRASELGYRALAITDECSMAGVVRAHVEAKRLGVQLIIGAATLHGRANAGGAGAIAAGLCRTLSSVNTRATCGTQGQLSA